MSRTWHAWPEWRPWSGIPRPPAGNWTRHWDVYTRSRYDGSSTSYWKKTVTSACRRKKSLNFNSLCRIWRTRARRASRFEFGTALVVKYNWRFARTPLELPLRGLTSQASHHIYYGVAPASP